MKRETNSELQRKLKGAAAANEQLNMDIENGNKAYAALVKQMEAVEKLNHQQFDKIKDLENEINIQHQQIRALYKTQPVLLALEGMLPSIEQALREIDFADHVAGLPKHTCSIGKRDGANFSTTDRAHGQMQG